MKDGVRNLNGVRVKVNGKMQDHFFILKEGRKNTEEGLLLSKETSYYSTEGEIYRVDHEFIIDYT